jgi:hypothetical protein
MVTKEEIRPIYSELQGYLAQAPQKTDNTTVIYAQELWESYNKTIKELSEKTGTTYHRYQIQPNVSEYSITVDIDNYRGKLGGIIARLHGEYFSDEPAPFSGMPSTTTISVNQQQSQSVQVEILLEMIDLIHGKINQMEEGSKEKSFLQKVKDSLRGVKSVTQLITLFVQTANELGLSMQELAKIFL